MNAENDVMLQKTVSGVVMDITRSLVSSLAPDSASVSAGDGLVNKNKFLKLNIDKEDTVIFGECAGSGKNPYYVSVDFINPVSPVSRCSCPSRKFPCKHAIGLMIAYADGRSFSEADVPEDILSKRDKLEKRSQKKEEQVKEALEKPAKAEKKAAPKKNSAAQLKKLQTQIDGLDIAGGVITSLVRDGIGSVTDGTVAEITKQAKQMGDYYLTGVQKQLLDLAAILKTKDKEAMYTQAYEKSVFIHALLKRGKEYLTAKLEDPFLLDTKTEIESLLGNVWKSVDLLDAGLAERDVRLMQLAFTVDDNEVIKEMDEKAVQVNLDTGEVVVTRNIIPKKASKYINSTDSVPGVVNIPVMYRYPGSYNCRVRWDEYTLTHADEHDYQKLISLATLDFATAVRTVKEHLKNPLSNKNPFVFVKFKSVGTANGRLVIEDDKGGRIALVDAREEGWFDTVRTLKTLGDEISKYEACLLRFKYLSDTGELAASPLTLAGKHGIVRMAF